jgi:hypothetical protein
VPFPSGRVTCEDRGMEHTVAVKITRENLQKVAEEFANSAPEGFEHIPKWHAAKQFKMFVEQAWSDGIEVFMHEEGFVHAEAGVMGEYEAAQA